MPWWVHTALGLTVVGLLVGAAWRLAGRTVPWDPRLRLLGAVVWWWLAVQLAGLATRLPLPGGTAVLGAGAALVLAGLALWRVPRGARGADLCAPGRPRPLRAPERSDPSPSTDDLVPPGRDDRHGRALLLAVGAAVLVLGALVLRRPVVGFDGLLYHLALPAAWVPQGALAGLPRVVDGLPIEAYPIGMELGLGWLIAVTGSTAVALLLSPVALGVMVVAIWSMTRTLGASALAAWGAVAAVAFSLPALTQGGQVISDVPAVALMAAGAALALEGARRVRRDEDGAGADALLLGFGGLVLSVGIKTTTACGVLLGLILAWRARRALVARLREAPSWLAPFLLAVVCGGAWLARNLVLHGHPSWPLLASSFGDPVPPLLDRVDARFLDHPATMLRVGVSAYLRLAWTVIGLLIAGVVLAVRDSGARRAVAGCGVLGALAWTIAPATGISTDAGLAAGAVRYLLPCWVLLAVGAWSWAGQDRRWRATVAVVAAVVLLVQAALAVHALAGGGPPLDVLPLRFVVIAVAVGAVVLVAASLRPGATRVVGRPWAVVVMAGVVVAGIFVATPGVWSRHAVAVGTGVPPVRAQPLVALGGIPAWSLGPYGRPGGVLARDCASVRRARAAGRTVAVGPSGAAAGCALPGAPLVVDGFRVWGPGVAAN